MARHRLAFSRWLKHNIIISSCPLALAASNCSLQTAGQRRRKLICMQCDQHENKTVCWPSHKPSSGEITAHKAGQHMRMLQLIYMPRFQQHAWKRVPSLKMARHRLVFPCWLKHNIIISLCPLALAASSCSLQSARQRHRKLIRVQRNQHENKAVYWPSHKPPDPLARTLHT